MLGIRIDRPESPNSKRNAGDLGSGPRDLYCQGDYSLGTTHSGVTIR